MAETQADMFVALDRTFAAFARVSRPFIQETITKGVEAEHAAIDDLPRIRPFLRNSARFFTALEPGARALARDLAGDRAGVHAGIPALRALAGRSTPSCRRPPRRCSTSSRTRTSSTGSTC